MGRQLGPRETRPEAIEAAAVLGVKRVGDGVCEGHFRAGNDSLFRGKWGWVIVLYIISYLLVFWPSYPLACKLRKGRNPVGLVPC